MIYQIFKIFTMKEYQEGLKEKFKYRCQQAITKEDQQRMRQESNLIAKKLRARYCV